jgi:hypothetical protein
MRIRTPREPATSGPPLVRGAAGPILTFPQSGIRARLFSSPESDDLESFIIVCLTVLVTVGGFLLSSPQFYHWFVIPVAVCGVITGMDAIAWIRGRVDLYDLVGILGLFGFHFFFLAPLLHVSWDLWMFEVSPPPDWRDWLGFMGILNVAGLFCYRVCRNVFKTGAAAVPSRVFWEIDRSLFRLIAPAALVIAAAAQVWLYARMGGITGFMQQIHEDRTALQGMGWLLMISESVPVLALFLIVVHFQQGKMSWPKAVGVLLLLFIVQMVFAGLRGSRTQTIQFLFWMVGCIHFLVRPVPRKMIAVGLVFMMAFLYLYLFYKVGGTSGASQAFSGSEQREQFSNKTGRSLDGVVLGDLGRADVQAFLLYRLMDGHTDYEYAKGRSYIGALTLILPPAVLPYRPEGKLKWGTDITWGTGRYVSHVKWSSRVYGLAGEAMLNFGPLSVPFAYCLFGLLVGWIRSYRFHLLPGDARFLLLPFVIYTGFSVLYSDSDNLVFETVKNGLMPAVVVAVCSCRRKRLPARLVEPVWGTSAPPRANVAYPVTRHFA